MKIRLVAGVMVSLWLSVACAAEDERISGELRRLWDGNALAVLPVLPAGKQPVIDGRLSESEWGGSVKLAGFMEMPKVGRKALVEGKRGFVYLGVDAEFLHVAVRTSTLNCDPGGGLVTRCGEGEECLTHQEDSVELVISPDSQSDTVYSLRFNSNGVLSDSRLSSGGVRSRDLSWSVRGLRKASRVGSGWWTLELSIPRSQIGDPRHGLRLNVGRTWSGLRPSSLVPTEDLYRCDRMMTLRWESHGVPVLKMDDLGAPEEGLWRVRLSVGQVPRGRRCRVSAELICMHYPAGKPSYSSRVSLAHRLLTSDGVLELQARASTNETHWLYVMLRDLESDQVLAQRVCYGYERPSSGVFPATAHFDLGELGRGSAYHYPGYDKAVLRMLLSPLAEVEEVVAETRLPDGGIRQTEAVLKGCLWEAVVPGGPASGRYVHAIRIRLQDGRDHEFPARVSLEKRHFPWEGNTLGKDPVILPPFTPIVTSGNRAEVLFRTFAVNASGLWDSVRARGRELLAEPMHYELVTESGLARPVGVEQAMDIRGGGYEAAVSNLSQASGVALKTETRLDYDGFCWNRVRVGNPGGRTIRRLTLVIPFRPGEATLFHGVGNLPDDNPAGAIPPGTGVVWSGDRVPKMAYYGHVLLPQFVPYVWVGSEERGISWMMQSSYGLRLDERRPAVRIVRAPGMVRLELDLINVPTALRDGDGFDFGLMASPVKPADRELFRYYRDDRGGKIPGLRSLCSVTDELAGVPRFFKEPYGQDYGLMKALTRMLTTGRHEDAFKAELARWDRCYLERFSRQTRGLTIDDGEDFMTWWKRVRGNFLGFVFTCASGGGNLPELYSDPRLVSFLEPTAAYFKTEWCHGGVGYAHTLRSYPTPSNLDYMVYCYDRWLAHGIRGIYLDEVAIHPCFNPDTEARRDRFGQLHSATGLLQLRELIRRIAVLQHRHGCKPRWLEVHMSNRLLIPCFSFATVQLGWEEHYGESEVQDRFPADYMRATLLGTKIGAASWALDGILRQTTPVAEWDGRRFRHLNRTMLAVLLPHNVRPLQRINTPGNGIDWKLVSGVLRIFARFRPWESDCRFVPYYAEDGGLAGMPEGVLASSYRRPGKALIVLGNQGEARRFSLELDRRKLGVSDQAVLWDGESGAVLGDQPIELSRRDFKVLWLAPAAEARALRP